MFLHDEETFTYVAAIEIGTSYSGYAYCQRKDGKSIAKDISMFMCMTPVVWLPFPEYINYFRYNYIYTAGVLALVV